MLRDLIAHIHAATRRTYGILRVHAELTLGAVSRWTQPGASVDAPRSAYTASRGGGSGSGSGPTTSPSIGSRATSPAAGRTNKKWNTRLELANAIFECLEVWHDRNGRHSQLGWLTPQPHHHGGLRNQGSLDYAEVGTHQTLRTCRAVHMGL